MDAFALNAAPVNGQDYEMVLLEGSIDVAMDVAGNGIRGVMLAGQSTLALATSADFSPGIMGAGAIDVAVDTDLSPWMKIAMRGDMDIVLDVNVTASVGKMLSGYAGMTFDAGFDLMRRAMGWGDIDILLDAQASLDIIGKIRIEGDIGIVVEPCAMRGRATEAHRPDFPLVLELGLDGSANLQMHDVEGDIDMALDLAGDARLGARVPLAGGFDTDFYAVMTGRRYAQVPIGGSADIAFSLDSMPAGRPALPVEYVPAPASRQFRVARPSRTRHVPHQDRRL